MRYRPPNAARLPITVTDLLYRYVTHDAVQAAIAAGWRCPKGNPQPAPMAGHHGAYAVLMVKEVGHEPEHGEPTMPETAAINREQIDEMMATLRTAIDYDHGQDLAVRGLPSEAAVAFRLYLSRGLEVLDMACRLIDSQDQSDNPSDLDG